MGSHVRFLMLLSSLMCGCGKTVLVSVPSRVDLDRYQTLGIVEFASNAEQAIDALATSEFEKAIRGAHPGTRLLDLGSRATLLASVGSTTFDSDSIRKIGEKYSVPALFLGEISYSDPKTHVNLTDINKLDPDLATEVRGDISCRLVETRSGARVWNSSARAWHQTGRAWVSAGQVNEAMTDADPRVEMVPVMVHRLTQDLRPSTVRQPAK
jgi:hypothetical protein